MQTLSILWDMDPVCFSIGSFEIRYYSLFWLTAFVCGFFIVRKFYIQERLNTNSLETLAIFVFAGAMIGARLFHCLFYDGEYFLSHPLEIFLPIRQDMNGDLSLSNYTGFASHGGIIGITIAFIIYCKIYKANAWNIADKMVVAGSLGGVFIRLGNFFNSEIIGTPTNLPWAVVFKQIDDIPRHPSQLYEAAFYLLTFFIVYYLYTRRREAHSAGFIAGIAILLGFIARFFIESTKVSQVSFEDSMLLNMGQILSIPFILIAAWVMYIKREPLITHT